ncbi:MAG TPA: hypothetical protein VGL94_05045 [Ktedonobacteraceae bacterium]|jgi:hypothetical protein
MEIYTYTDFIQPIEELASQLDVLNKNWHKTLQKWEGEKKKRITLKQRKALCDIFINNSVFEIKAYTNTIHDIVKYMHQAEAFLSDNQLVMLKDVIGDDSWQDLLAWDCFWNDSGQSQ